MKLYTSSFFENARSWTIALARRMDWYRGLRAGTALSTPLLLADLTGLTHLGWAALGGMEAIVSDAGGPYRIRLGRLSVVSLGGALAIFAGTLAGNDLRWALPVTLLFCFGWTYLSVVGQPFTSAGLLVQVIFICGIGEPETSVKEAALRAAFVLMGGVWATILSLFLWPLDPYRPARRAVSMVYRLLADFLKSIHQLQQRPGAISSTTWERENLTHKRRLRRQIEQAWEAVASVRAESQAETTQGRQLIILLESADLILQRAVALAEHAETSRLAFESAISVSSEATGLSNLHALNDIALWLSAFLIRRKVRRKAREPNSLDPVRTKIAEVLAATAIPAADPDRQFIADQESEIASNLETVFEISVSLRSESVRSAIEDASLPFSAEQFPSGIAEAADRNWNSFRDRLTSNWRKDSLSLRHAARVAIVCGFDVCLIERRHVGHGYWLMMTSLIVLQPHVSGTLRRGLQRIGGTVGGGILAALLAIVLHSQLVTGIVLFPLALLALALLPVNYAAFAFFLTPTFVLAFLRHTGDWQLAMLRIGNTIAGAAIAIAAMTVLFPSYERERIGSYFHASLKANRLYLEQLIRSWENTSDADPAINPTPRTIALARRATGLAHSEMEESLERVLAETFSRSAARKTSSEALMAFAAYLNRFSQSITGLVAITDHREWKRSAPVQASLAAVHSRLLWLEEQLDASLHPAEDEVTLPEWSSVYSPYLSPRAAISPEDATAQRQLTRLERQKEVIRRHLQAVRNQIARH